MIFQILDRQFNTLATMDNSLAGAIHFFDDEFHQYLNEGVSTFNFSVLRNHADTEYLVEGNYIYFTSKSRDYLMTIRRIEADEWQLDISTEDLSFDLINEYAAPYKATAARKITAYLNDILVDSDVVIGLNEVSSYTRKLEWTGESTVLERVLSIMTKFDAECEFITELNPDRSLKQITLNIYHKYDDKHQGVGVDRTDVELRLGENVRTVKKTTDITELYTSIRPVGNEGVNIKNIEETIKDENGVVLFYTKKGSEYIYAPVANDRFGRKHAEKGGYINMHYEFDTDSATTLYGNALSNLKKYSEPAVTYEVEGYYDLNIGDVVSIADNGYSPMLLLEARVAELIVSFCNPENNKTVFSNYRVFDSQISSSLLEIMDQMKEDVDYAVQVAKTPIFNISSKGSAIFKNGEGSVELSATVERANTDVTSEYSIFNWIKQNKDGSVDNEWTANHENYGKTVVITPADFNDTATFHYEAVKEDKLYIGGSATVTKVYDGEDGKTPIKGVDYFDGQDGTNGLSAYLHIKYSQNADGNPMTSDPTGAKYVGMQASQNPTPSTVPADYDWTLVKGADGIQGETGADGKTSYLHIKYSNDGGKTFTGNGGEDAGSWIGQYVDFVATDSTDVKQYAWSKIKGENGQDGVAGKDGVGLESTTVSYALSDSDNVAPNSGWTSTVPTLIKGKYLWTRSVWKYTDNTTETGYSVTYVAKDGNDGSDGIAGKDGVGISSTVITYAKSASGTTAPTSGWTATVPSVPEGQFLWTKAVWTYTDSTTETGYSVAKMGDTGPAGNGIVSTAITYQASTSGTTTPSGNWSTTIPSVAANQYLWTRTVITYTNNTNSTSYSVGKMGANGADGQDGADGNDGISVASVVEEYYVSTSPTSQAGGSWSTTVPNNADPNKYIWRRLKTTLSDSSISYTSPALVQGMTGIYPYIGPTQPANPKEGQQWWKSDESGNITDFYVYKSGSWQGQTIQQSVLNIIALNAVTITGSTITGTTINGSEFKNSGTFQDQGYTMSYNTTQNGPIKMDWKVTTTNQNGQLLVMPNVISSFSWSNAAKTQTDWSWVLNSDALRVTRGDTRTSNEIAASYGAEGIQMTDYRQSYGIVQLKYQDLMTLPKVQIPAASGWSAYGTSGSNEPTCQRVGRLVQLAGAFKNNGTVASGAEGVVMGTLPVGYRPLTQCNFIVQASGANVYLLTVYTNGQVTLNRHRGWDGSKYAMTACSAGSWLNIACVFSAADV